MVKIKNKILILIALFFLLILIPNVVKATYLNISAPSSGNPGSSVNVTISSDCTGRFNISVDNGTLNGSSKIWLEASSSTFSVTLGQSGSTKVTVTPANPVSFNKEDVELGGQQKNITINSSNNGGSNGGASNGGTTSGDSPTDNLNSSSIAELSMITTSPVDFTGFKSNKYKYYVTVENSVTEVGVSAKAKNGGTYRVSGNKNLQEGTNKVTVTAVSKDGKNTQNYYVYVTRKTANNEEIIPNEVEQNENEEETEQKLLRLENLVLDDTLNVKLEPNFDPEIFEYKVILGNEYLDLEELFINAISNIENAKITIEGNKNLKDGENIVTITVEAEGCETVVYKVTVVKGQIEEAIETTADVTKIDNDLLDNSKEIIRKRILICIFTLIITLIGIIFIAKECYESTYNKDEIEDNKEEDSDNLNNENIDNESDEDNLEENNILADIYNKNRLKETNEQKNSDNKIEENNSIDENTNENEIFSKKIFVEKEKEVRRKRGKGKHC